MRQRDRITAAIDANEAHLEVLVAWLATLELRSAFRHKDLGEGARIAEHVLDSFPSCPIPEIARLLATGPDPEAMAGTVPGVLHHRPRQQRRHGGSEWTDRAAPPRRPRLQKSGQLPAPDAPDRRSLHRPPAGMTSHLRSQDPLNRDPLVDGHLRLHRRPRPVYGHRRRGEHLRWDRRWMRDRITFVAHRDPW